MYFGTIWERKWNLSEFEKLLKLISVKLLLLYFNLTCLCLPFLLLLFYNFFFSVYPFVILAKLHLWHFYLVYMFLFLSAVLMVCIIPDFSFVKVFEMWSPVAAFFVFYLFLFLCSTLELLPFIKIYKVLYLYVLFIIAQFLLL